jgi:hypothetical protein
MTSLLVMSPVLILERGENPRLSLRRAPTINRNNVTINGTPTESPATIPLPSVAETPDSRGCVGLTDGRFTSSACGNLPQAITAS